ncbi:FG-GAP-like repeat-containing protein [Leifsonia sp. Leaf336]|uniref:FG-GAP-like repeat-containing protein n=1 Tax=Leifsonia sp. Leaf336 TaxID=1736341 RepID=UPI000A666A52|nr:FG-GAP-like repeat-containing protein [Leifsonia sp. Leaf336]
MGKITNGLMIVGLAAATVLGISGLQPASAQGVTAVTSVGEAAPPALPDLAGHPHKRTCADPRSGRAACFAEVVQGVASPSVGAAPAGYGPADLRAAYALTAATTAGAGATVAVIDAFDLPSAESDLATYRSTFGLPPCTSGNGCFRKLDQRGGTSYPATSHAWGPETAIDLEMVSAACPNCRILLVEADSDLLSNLGAAAQTAVLFGAKYVSNSYGAIEAGNDFSSFDHYYDHPGVVVTASSGDAGYGTQFPASSQYVTAVGGTSLVRAGNARGWSESAWSGAGSGCSSYSPIPSWQSGTGCPTKSVSDISAVADPSTGVAGFGPTPTAPYSSAWQVFGGTSVSSPLIAGMYALAGVPADGTYPASYPWAKPSALNDVTSGTNGAGCSPAQACSAGPGYDGPTGLGTPNGVAALAAPTPGAAREVTGDFNSDHTSDLLARNASGALILYRGDGAGGWLSPQSAVVGSGWNGMTAIVSAGDFDGDGRNDLLARDSGGFLWLYPGDGASGWFTPRKVGSGWNIMTSIIAARDFNGDGTADIAAIDSSGVFWLYPGDGHGGWLAPRAIGSGWNGMTAVGIDDFDGDGSPDILARDSIGRLWLYGHTSAGWKTPVVVGTGWNGLTIVSEGDFNGDGHADLLGRWANGALVLYAGNGHSGWLSQRQIGSGWNIMSWMG